MNFNKDYPIAILDTNIAITVPNILNILKGCNIVIPYTLIDKLDKVKKENVYGVRDLVNNFLALSEKENLSKDGYTLENDCMLYLDIDKNNSYHKDINLDSKNQDIKFIAEAKNLKEKYNDMEVVLISSDKIMKITASIFDVKVKFLEEFITEYLKEEFKLNILFNLLVESKDYYDKYTKIVEYRVAKYIEINSEENYYRVREIIFKIVSDNKDIDGLYKLSESYDNREVYEKIFEILSENKDIDGLYKLSENILELVDKPKKEIYEVYKKYKDYINNRYYHYGYDKEKTSYDKEKTIREIKEFKIDILENIYNKIFDILAENKDIDGLCKLSKSYNPNSESYNPNEEIYEKIFEILSENKDIDGLYKLSESYNSAKIYNKISNILVENKDIDGLYKLSESYNHIEIYNKILNILAENKDIDGLYKLYEIYESEKIYIIYYSYYNREDYKVKIYKAISNILAENKDIDGLYKLFEIYKSSDIYDKIFNILVENKDIDGLHKLKSSLYLLSRTAMYFHDLPKKIDYKIRKLENNK